VATVGAQAVLARKPDHRWSTDHDVDQIGSSRKLSF
jgi:hypothetical protein